MKKTEQTICDLMETPKCPKCKDEMNLTWKCQFEYHPGIDSDNDHWSLIKNNVIDEWYECFDCGIIIKKEKEDGKA